MFFNREIYFDSVRASLFSGSMNDDQVKGQEAILGVWEKYTPNFDVRFLANMLATTYHETSQEMMPIEEYGKGEGMEYGKTDPETGQKYYGRGFVQTTWRENYARADEELGLTGDASCEWHAENQLDPVTAARTMFKGMHEGWFRSDENGRETLPRYFSATVDDPYNAREIINGDKSKIPSWSNGKSIGNLIKGYHEDFLRALEASAMTEVVPPPEGHPGAPPIEEIEHPPQRPTRYEEITVEIRNTPVTLKFLLPKGSKVEIL